MRKTQIRPVAVLVTSFALFACGAAAPESDVVGTDELSYDTLQNPTEHGGLELGEESSAALTADERYHAFDFSLMSRSDVRLYTLPALYEKAAVDTVLAVYKQGARGWGNPVASSDDARRTVWSEITRKLDAGTYRVLVKGKSTRVRGAFRVGFESPQLRTDAACVFGTTFREVRGGRTVTVERERLVDHASQLTAIEQRQLVDALHASSHTDVTTPEEALARIDANEVNVLHLWDASNARAFVAFEYGAGDNSYGRIYPPESTTAVTSIHDGDLLACTVAKGNGGRDCRADAECGGGFTCAGFSRVSNVGKCVSTAALEGDGDACTAEWAGGCKAGLVCTGLTRWESGSCRPAWMKGSFSEWYGVAVPDNRPAGISRALDVHGLATVDVDVSLRAVVRHAKAAQLKVTLTNPAGTEVTVFDGATGGTDLHLDGPVVGFSGDESVNGSWTLKVIDKQRGTTGSLERWGIELTSRWD